MPQEDQRLPEFKYLPISIRLETLGGLASTLVLRGTPLPAQRQEVFSTAEDNQSAVEFKVLAGERELASKNLVLGEFRLSGIPPAPRGQLKIHVTLSVNALCAVSVKAFVDGTELTASEDLQLNSKYLREGFLEKLRADAETNRAADGEAVKGIHILNRANSLIAEAEWILSNSAARPAYIDARAVSDLIAKVGLAIESNDHPRIIEASTILSEALKAPDELDVESFSPLYGFDRFFPSFTSRKPKGTSRPRSKEALDAQSRLTELHGASSVGRIFGGGAFEVDPALCFVLMPFRPEFRPIYDDHIKPSIERVGLRCERADEMHGVDQVTRDIWAAINRAVLLIADLSGQNPNVFYEVGLAHALGKDVLLTTQSMSDVPFDLKSVRCLLYDYTPRGMQVFETRLEASLRAIVKAK